MNAFITSAYLHEVRRLSRSAVSAASQVDHALRTQNPDALFSSLDELLNSSAKIAQFLWPTQERIKGRGEKLRSMLRVKDDSPIRDKGLRNYLEHFDEHLDKWAKTQEGLDRRRYIDLHVGLRDLSDMFDDASGAVPMRHYVPDELLYMYSGREFFVQPLAFAVRDLALRCDDAIRECQQEQIEEIKKMIVTGAKANDSLHSGE